MSSFKEIFARILTAEKEESRQAAREVRKYLYSSHDEREKYNEIKNLIENAPAKYAEIAEVWRQENFATAISVIFFLREKKPLADYWFPWQFALLEHENGNIRQAAVRMLTNELGPLTVHLRFPGKKSYQDIPIEEADKMLLEIFVRLRHLLHLTWKSNYKKHKYVSNLPSSPYKSGQLVMGEFVDDCGKEYVKKMEDFFKIQGDKKLMSEDGDDQKIKSPMSEVINGFFNWLEDNQERFEEKGCMAFDLFWADRSPDLPAISENEKSRAFFQEWLMLDYSFNGYDNTLPGARRSFLAEYLDGNKLVSNNYQLALQMITSYPSFYKVINIKAGEYIEVCDLFFGKESRVYDRNSSRMVDVDQVIYSRHCAGSDGKIINCGSSITVVPEEKFEMLKVIILGTYELVNQEGYIISLSDFLKWNSYIYYRELMYLLKI